MVITVKLRRRVDTPEVDFSGETGGKERWKRCENFSGDSKRARCGQTFNLCLVVSSQRQARSRATHEFRVRDYVENSRDATSVACSYLGLQLTPLRC